MASNERSFPIQNEEGETSTNKVEQESYPCHKHFVKEWNDASYFNLLEPNGKALHVQNTFARASYWNTPQGEEREIVCSWLLLFRIAAILGTATEFFWSWFVLYKRRVNQLAYMAFFTRWNILLILFYQGSMVLLTTCPKSFLYQPSGSRKQPSEAETMKEEEEEEEERNSEQAPKPVARPHPLVRFAWVLHSAIVPFQFIIIPAYWVLSGTAGREHSTQHMVASLAEHALIPLLFLFDGMIWHRIPLRLRHVVLSYAIVLVYLVFYVVYDVTTNIGNGSHDWEPVSDNSSVYKYGWGADEWHMTLMLFLVVLLLYLPAVYGICWCLSLLSHSSSATRSLFSWALDGSHRCTVVEGTKQQQGLDNAYSFSLASSTHSVTSTEEGEDIQDTVCQDIIMFDV